MSTNNHDLSNALKAQVLPVGTATPGSNVAHSLATPAKNDDPKAAGVNKVIVVFKSGTPASEIENAISNVESQGGNITHRYESALLGFSAELPDSSVMAMTDNVHVDYVEPDGEVTAYARKAMENKK
ncbi:hypothetical protein BGZ68_005080 [Mortierella alpina]|nr:hypothetical protein BGZ68_005080 [Mortierella alpina]